MLISEYSPYFLMTEKYWWNYAVGILTIVILGVASVIIIYMIVKRRNAQPLKKKSPLLMILSVIGNFLCLFNISTCFLFYEEFKD